MHNDLNHYYNINLIICCKAIKANGEEIIDLVLKISSSWIALSEHFHVYDVCKLCKISL